MYSDGKLMLSETQSKSIVESVLLKDYENLYRDLLILLDTQYDEVVCEQRKKVRGLLASLEMIIEFYNPVIYNTLKDLKISIEYVYENTKTFDF